MQTDISKRMQQDQEWTESVFDYARELGLPLTAAGWRVAERALIARLHVQARNVAAGRPMRPLQAVVAPQLHSGATYVYKAGVYEAGAAEALRRVRDALGDRNCAHDVTIRNVARDLGVEL
jgi:hypothetical protein